MEGYNSGYGYLSSGFPASSVQGQQDGGSVAQHQVNLPYSQQTGNAAQQDMLQSYPHLRHTIGHDYQSPVSPLTTQTNTIPRFPLSFPQLGSFPGFQNPEFLQQILELQQITNNRQQNVGNFSNILSNYIPPAHSFLGQSIPGSVGNLQQAQDPKSPINLHCSPAPSPARTSPDFSGYTQQQPVTSFPQTSLTVTNTSSIPQDQYPVSIPSFNSTSSTTNFLHDVYPYKVKDEPLQIPNIHAAFLGTQAAHQEPVVKIPEIFSENEQQSKNSLKQNVGRGSNGMPGDVLHEAEDVPQLDTVTQANKSKEVRENTVSVSKPVLVTPANNDKQVRDNVVPVSKYDSITQANKKKQVKGNNVPLSKKDIKTQEKSVKFFSLGKMFHSSKIGMKGPNEVLSELVDCEERLFLDIILNLPVKKEHIEEMEKHEVKEIERETVETKEEIKEEDDSNFVSPISNSEKEILGQGAEESGHEIENDIDNLDSLETKLDLDDYDADDSHLDNSVSFDAVGIQDNWYSAAMKKYAELNGEVSPEVMTPKKGGRSDPENPFAITSPSFSESAAKALVVTTNSDNATLVMVSIMSIGSRKKLIPNLVNSEAAKGGIVSVVNPVDTDSDIKDSKNKNSSESRQKNDDDESDSKEDHDESAIDRLDISIKIDDDQYLTHGEHKRWQCKLCTKSYTTKHNLVAHILDHCHIKPHLCLVCGKYFKQLSHLNTHMLTHDNVKPHVCEVCQKGFTQISHLKRHQTVHCDSKPYVCDICNRGFAYPSELRIHKDKHTPGKDKCVDCGAEFPNLNELREHMTLHEHGNKVELMCQHCNKSFRFPSQLKDHMMTHAGSRPFMCTECGMDFMKEHHLKAHQFTHTGLRPYSCPYCSRSFNQKANMVRHMLIHNAQRAFKCQKCGKTFTQPQTLKAHMVVHEDKKPYSCKFCGKQFGRLHNLQGHLHIHNNTKPYTCSVCGSAFTLKGNLNRHRKVKHGLSDSMENLEEDAVNFLDNLSEHVPDINSSYEEQDVSRDEVSMMDSADNGAEAKSPKKGRKSIPRKRVCRSSEKDSSEIVENGNDAVTASDDDDRLNDLTYSEEERENEGRSKQDGDTSKYFSISNQTLHFRVKQSDEATQNEKFLNSNTEGTKDMVQDIDYNGDTDTETDGNQLQQSTNKGKRPSRKRKIKCFAEDFVGEDFEDENTEGWNPQPTKVRKKKGANLDFLIASKFKNT